MKDDSPTRSIAQPQVDSGWLPPLPLIADEEKNAARNLPAMVGWLRLYEHIMRKTKRLSRPKP